MRKTIAGVEKELFEMRTYKLKWERDCGVFERELINLKDEHEKLELHCYTLDKFNNYLKGKVEVYEKLFLPSIYQPSKIGGSTESKKKTNSFTH